MGKIIAVGQMCATGDVEENFETCRSLVGRAKDRGADLLSLPECFAFIGEKDTDLLDFARPLSSELFDRYRQLAADAGMWLSLGGFQESVDGQAKAANAHVIVDDTGTISSVYRKIHLFDVDIPGGPRLLESKSTAGGDSLVVTDSIVGKIGLSVCYDLRFAEQYLALAKMGADVLLIPAAFTLPTGKEHWEPLLRARAIETQCYVAAAAQRGRHNSRRESYGHAMIIDPWGSIVAQCSDRTDVAVAEIDLDYVQQVRARMPVFNHRHPEIYGAVGSRNGD